MVNAAFPRWAAPILGPVVGALISAKGAMEDGDNGDLGWWIIGGTALGLVAGGLIWLVDRPIDVNGDEVTATGLGNRSWLATPVGGSVVGRILALISILLVWAPIVGFGVSALAAWLNYRTRGWPWKVSLTTMAIGLVVTLSFLVILALEASS